MDSLENRLYVNGELAGSGDSSSDDWSSFAGTFYAGARFSGGNFFNGDIAQVQLFSEAKSAAWVAEQYAYGAESVQGKTDWAAQESIANETTGFLSNTPFQIGSGTWKASTDTIDGQLCKVIECVAAGFVYMPTTKFDGSPTADAYGSWDFWITKSGSSNPRVIFHAAAATDWNSASQNGYSFALNTGERVYLPRTTAGVELSLFVSALSTVVPGVWNEARVTRDHSGEFSCYLDGALVVAETGSNPVTDTNFTTASYIVLSFGAGDKFAYADLDGDHSLIKQLGVVAP